MQGGVDMSSGNHLVHSSHSIQAEPPRHWERRDFVKGVTALTGAAALSAYDMRWAAAEPPPEITKIRLVKIPAICLAPEYVAEELLRGEGFSEVSYVEMASIHAGEMLR